MLQKIVLLGCIRPFDQLCRPKSIFTYNRLFFGILIALRTNLNLIDIYLCVFIRFMFVYYLYLLVHILQSPFKYSPPTISRDISLARIFFPSSPRPSRKIFASYETKKNIKKQGIVGNSKHLVKLSSRLSTRKIITRFKIFSCCDKLPFRNFQMWFLLNCG